MTDKYHHGFHERGYLPHQKQENAAYFVTFRLADSLPREVLDALETELNAMPSVYAVDSTEHEAERMRERRRRIEAHLDSGWGECWLRRGEVAGLVEGSLRHFHDSRYELGAWVVMPNHVHVVVRPLGRFTLGEIVKGWKAFTGLRANRLLGLGEGKFWQPESYDHWVRDDEEMARIVRYVHNNPVKAKLCAEPEDWKWSGAWRGE
jgi:REP element-mobilizing transposase RayT